MDEEQEAAMGSDLEGGELPTAPAVLGGGSGGHYSSKRLIARVL